MNLTGKFYNFYSQGLFDEDIYPDQIGVLINYDVLTDDDKELIISNLDFRINKNAVRENIEANYDEDLGQPCWKLIDVQGGNLANIESDEFAVGDYDSILDRLDNYYHDYGYYFARELEYLQVPYTILDEIESL